MASTNGDRRGPGRPPNPQRARERQRTLTEAAALEFAEKGYHKASITDITQRAGVGRGTRSICISIPNAMRWTR